MGVVDGQGAFVEGAGAVEVVLGVKDEAEVAEGAGRFGVVRA
jgi:hypothetical protein